MHKDLIRISVDNLLLPFEGLNFLRTIAMYVK